MNCPLEVVRQDGDRYVHRCRKCKTEVRSKYRDPAKYKRQCGKAVPPSGPGTEFFKITNAMGVKPKKACDCARLRREMDEGGVDYCRQHRDCLLGKLRKNLEHYTVTEKATAAWAAIRQGLPLSLEGMLDLAVERAADASPAAPPPTH